MSINLQVKHVSRLRMSIRKKGGDNSLSGNAFIFLNHIVPQGCEEAFILQGLFSLNWQE